MADGQWGMGNGRWAMGDGEWPMGNGGWGSGMDTELNGKITHSWLGH
jgi:hypothetical protein